MSLLYRGIYFLGIVLSILLLPFSSKLRKGLWGRVGLLQRIKRLAPKKGVWFHVCSSGELEQAIPIMERVREMGKMVLLTFYSPSAVKGIEAETARRKQWKIALPWDYADYAPLDFKFVLRKFIDVVEPTHFVAVNREIWPSLLEVCREKGVPAYLFATYFWPRARKWVPIYRKWLEMFDFVGTTHAETTEYLRSVLQRPQIETLGDPRIERVLDRKARQTVAPSWAAYFQSKKVFLLGSIWREDFEALSPALEQLAQKGWILILAPHQPEEKFVEELHGWFQRKKLPVARWTRWNTQLSPSHLIIDTVGQLAELYRIATMVFVGGSFKYRVHNVLEPAAYGKLIMTGPFIQNSAEALEMRSTAYGLRSLESAANLLETIETFEQDPQTMHVVGSKTLLYLTERKNTSRRYCQRLLAH